MTRRQLLAAAIAALPVRAASRFDRSRLSILTDEIGTLDQAITFAQQYKLSFVELRAYRPWTREELTATKKKLDAAGLRVSFFNSALLKYTRPGTTAVKWEDFYEDLYKKAGLTPEKMEATREQDLEWAIQSAKALGAPALRTFGYWRVADPGSQVEHLVSSLSRMVKQAAGSGVTVCLENELATNVATSAEAATILNRVPGLMLNWDPQNSANAGEASVFPDGFAKFPRNRIANVQLKAEGLLGMDLTGPANKIDWPGIFAALERDGYAGRFGLETHTLKGPEVNIPASHRSVRRMLELVHES